MHLAQRFNIHHGTLHLAGRIDGGLFEQFRVAAQHVVGRVGDGLLKRRRVLLTVQGKGEDHLAFPDGDGGEYAGLDFFRQRPVVALDDAYLRRGLHRDGPRKLQIVQPPLETVDLLRKVADLLRFHEIAGRIRLCLEARQFHSTRLFQFALARFNVRRQFRVEPRIVLIEHLKRLDVAEQADHGLVQLVDDDFDLFRKGVELRHRALGGREQRAHKRQRLEEPPASP